VSAADDARLAATLASSAGELLVTLRADAFARGWTGKEAGRAGDHDANELLLAALAENRPGDAVLSEESADDLARLDADRVWIVDPLDGTREYGLEGRTDWAVHVALWERTPDTTGREGGAAGPTAGVATGTIAAAAVALPALGKVLSSDDAFGPVAATTGPVRTVVSDSRPPAWLGALGGVIDLDVVPMGSAGAKAMAVVRGEADAYVHAGGQYEWDSAAPVGVALAAGLHASRLDGSPLRYNLSPPYLPDLVICCADLAAPLLAALASVGAS
jgi:3'(2'), 5'-bisphosphate nucleotidase